MNLANEYIQSVLKRILYYKELADKSFAVLSESDFYIQPNPESNSIAIIIQHMAGNMLSRWTDFLTSDGEKEWRNRDAEFENQQLSKSELIAYWEKGWTCLRDALEVLTENDLQATIHIRSEALTVVDAINRQLAHYPYHVGQIVYLARMIRGNEWVSLSIPKGNSAQFNQDMEHKNKQ